MEKATLILVIAEGTSVDTYYGLAVQKGWPSLPTIGWAIMRSKVVATEFGYATETRHISGIDQEGNYFSEWDKTLELKSDRYRSAGDFMINEFRATAGLTEFPFFLSNVGFLNFFAASFAIRLDVKYLEELPDVQRDEHNTEIGDEVLGFPPKQKPQLSHPIEQKMLLPVEIHQGEFDAFGAIHLRQRLHGDLWAVDYFGLHSQPKTDLAGFVLTRTVFDVTRKTEPLRSLSRQIGLIEKCLEQEKEQNRKRGHDSISPPQC